MPEDLRWNAATLWAGPKCHIVHYPLSGWKVFNLVVTYHNDAPEPVAGKPVPDEEVRARLRPRLRARAEHHPPRQGLAHVGAVRPRSDRQVDRRPGRAAGRRRPPDAAIHGPGRLHGDGGRGLPGRFARRRRHRSKSGLVTYRDRRVLRTTRVQLMSRAMGDHVYHPAGPHAALRNAIMSAKSQAEWLRCARLALWRQRARLIAGRRDYPPLSISVQQNTTGPGAVSSRPFVGDVHPPPADRRAMRAAPRPAIPVRRGHRPCLDLPCLKTCGASFAAKCTTTRRDSSIHRRTPKRRRPRRTGEGSHRCQHCRQSRDLPWARTSSVSSPSSHHRPSGSRR